MLRVPSIRPRRAIGTVGLLMTALTFGACGSDDGGGGAASGGGGGGDSAKPVDIAHFIVAQANTHQQGMVKGVEAAAKELGNVKVRTFSAEFDPNKQVQQIQTAVASGQYDALLIESVDGARVVPAIKRAAAKKLTVVCAFSVCGPKQDEFSKQMPEVAAQLGINTGDLGKNAAPIVNEACAGKDPCNLVIMAGAPALVTEKRELDLMKAGLKEFPNVKIVATGEGGFLADPAYKSMKDILQAQRKVDVVFSPGDQMIVGVEQALQEAGRKDVALIGSGASVLGTKAIKEGRWFASGVLRPYNDGYNGLKFAVKAARGEKVPPLTDTGLTPVAPGGYITKENVDRWKPEWQG
jgi:ribose transport system substrate-binding protein